MVRSLCEEFPLVHSLCEEFPLQQLLLTSCHWQFAMTIPMSFAATSARQSFLERSGLKMAEMLRINAVATTDWLVAQVFLLLAVQAIESSSQP